MARIKQAKQISGKRILLVDDQNDYIVATTPLLEREGHEVEVALTGEDALKLLQEKHFDLLLLDYYMPGMTGEEVVNRLRVFNPYIQVILQTGYAGDYPPREMLQRLDIQGYHDKSEGPDKLLLWVDVGLKIGYTIQLLDKSRRGLSYILDVTPELHRIQTLKSLLQGILWQIAGLLEVVNSFVAIFPKGEMLQSLIAADSFLAITDEENCLTIKVATGRFMAEKRIDTNFDDSILKKIYNVLLKKTIITDKNSTVIPLLVGENTLGLIYLDQCVINQEDFELLQIFANQAAVAIQNSFLYEMATIDPLTKLYTRRFLDQLLLREIRSTFRFNQQLSVLMIDLDEMKNINDTYGHPVGDQALAIIGRVLQQEIRNNDIAGRYGGDEFVIILPNTSQEGLNIVGRRILESLKKERLQRSDYSIELRVSIGGAETGVAEFYNRELSQSIPQDYFENMALKLIQQADKMLYQAKREGGYRVCLGSVVDWLSLN